MLHFVVAEGGHLLIISEIESNELLLENGVVELSNEVALGVESDAAGTIDIVIACLNGCEVVNVDVDDGGSSKVVVCERCQLVAVKIEQVEVVKPVVVEFG